MKVREFIQMDVDMDVYDDVCEELQIAFCGPLKLTKEGEEKFGEVMDYEIRLSETDRFHSYQYATVEIDGKDWKKTLRKAEDFFYAAAGNCAWDDYDRWFTAGDNSTHDKLCDVDTALNDMLTDIINARESTKDGTTLAAILDNQHAALASVMAVLKSVIAESK